MSELLARRKVLVVEDEMLILLMIEHMLADLGCDSITGVATVDKALTMINSQSFDAAMLDLNLGGVDSNSIAEALTAREIPFFYCTGNGDHAMNKGFKGQSVLRKPFRFSELTNMFTRILSPAHLKNDK